jgi:hypothetical protein
MCEGYNLNNRRSPTGDELQSFDVFGKHLTTSDIFQNYDRTAARIISFAKYPEMFY